MRPLFFTLIWCFISSVEGQSVMPLSDFYGNQNGLLIELFWITTDSSIMKPYIVERSNNGIIWENIATIQPDTGANSYQFTDTTLSGYYEKLYYRLKQDEADLYVYLSKVLVFHEVQERLTDAAIYPVPAHEFIYLNYSPSPNEWASVKIFDVAGRELLKIPSIVGTNRTIEIDISALLIGNYIFVLITDKEVKTWKFSII